MADLEKLHFVGVVDLAIVQVTLVFFIAILLTLQPLLDLGGDSLWGHDIDHFLLNLELSWAVDFPEPIV